MKKILVVADPVGKEQTALAKALELAKPTSANIHIVQFCYEPLNFAEDDNEASEIKTMVVQRAEEEWELHLHSKEVNIDISSQVIWEKNMANWLTEHCQSQHYDLIVKSGNRTESFFHTPTDWQLFRESGVPVYCVSTAEHNTNKVILVALDVLSDNKKKLDLNQQLLEVASQLSVQTGAELRCCSGFELPQLVIDMNLIEVEERIASLTELVKEKARPLLEAYDIDPSKLLINEGEPWQFITQFGYQSDAQCIVIGSMGRKGILGKLIGNTAEKVIHHSKTDLLVVPPKQEEE